MTGTRWLRWATERPGSGLRLFCFPHAGSGPALFMGWAGGLGPDVTVAGVCLPGREHRINEPRIRRMAPLAEALAEELGPDLRQPYAFFGHSLGALIAFATCHHLEAIGHGPVHLFVSGAAAPHDPRVRTPVHTLDDSALMTHARAFGGLPPAVMAHPDLLRLVLPTLRDDFELAETYRPQPGVAVRADLTALGGAHDPSVPAAALRCWRDRTSGRFGVIEMPGGHFYLIEHERSVLRMIQHRLASELPVATAHRTNQEVRH
jgi:medium-chain acyl-[acyl-carrier-protein] hydrolase